MCQYYHLYAICTNFQIIKKYFHFHQIQWGQEVIEEFLTQLYRNFLGREPDAPGMNYWQTSLNQGLDTSVSITKRFLDSLEHQTA